MALNDFIKKQQESVDLSNISKSELLQYLVNGFKEGQYRAAKSTYGM